MGLVPIAPALCCKTCLSKTIHPLDSCSDLNFCSGHGVCNLGNCDCLDGYGGPDCGSQVCAISLNEDVDTCVSSTSAGLGEYIALLHVYAVALILASAYTTCLWHCQPGQCLQDELLPVMLRSTTGFIWRVNRIIDMLDVALPA